MIDFRAARGAGRGTAFLPRTARKAARGDARPPAHDSSRGAPGGTSVCSSGRRSTPPLCERLAPEKRRRAGYRLPPHSKSTRQTCERRKRTRKKRPLQKTVAWASRPWNTGKMPVPHLQARGNGHFLPHYDMFFNFRMTHSSDNSAIRQASTNGVCQSERYSSLRSRRSLTCKS